MFWTILVIFSSSCKIFLNKIKLTEVETIINKYSIESVPLSTPNDSERKTHNVSEKIMDRSKAVLKNKTNIFSKALILFVLATTKAMK